METNDLSLNDLLDTYREKITKTWTEVLATHERLIEQWVATGDLLNEAKAAGRKADEKWMTEVFPLLCPGDKPFGIGKATKLTDIADTPELGKKNSSNWKNLPAHISTLYALSKVDAQVGKQGTLASWIAGELVVGGKEVPTMHPDLEKAQVDAIVALVIRDQEPLSAGWKELGARDVVKALGVTHDEAKKMLFPSPSPAPAAKPEPEVETEVADSSAPEVDDAETDETEVETEPETETETEPEPEREIGEEKCPELETLILAHIKECKHNVCEYLCAKQSAYERELAARREVAARREREAA